MGWAGLDEPVQDRSGKTMGVENRGSDFTNELGNDVAVRLSIGLLLMPEVEQIVVVAAEHQFRLQWARLEQWRNSGGNQFHNRHLGSLRERTKASSNSAMFSCFKALPHSTSRFMQSSKLFESDIG